MNLTAEQKKYLVPASIGAAVFVLCDEILFPNKPRRNELARPSNKSLLGAAAGTALTAYLYDKSTPDEKADIEKYALPAGAGSVAFAAINRFSAPVWTSSTPKERQTVAFIAAGLSALLVGKKDGSSPTVGMLPERTFEPPFPPPFGPEFPPTFEG